MTASERGLNAFLRQVIEDQASGRARTAAQYQALFPGHDDVIAERCAAFASSRRESGGARRPCVPESISHYRVEAELGRGGQGIVYLAEDENLPRRVALKVLSGLGSLTPDRVARFLREADVASRLNHPGIATVYEVGVDGSTPFIAMQFVEGRTLASQIAAEKSLERPTGPAAPALSKTPADVARTLLLFEQVARALHAAHERGIVHRDVKPGNIMVSDAGDPVLLDFGLAQDLDAETLTLTGTGDQLGTPAYMSPEQVSSQGGRPDRRTDVYSLGVSLFECLALARPFDAPTRAATYQTILSADPPDLTALNRAVSTDLRIVVETAIEKDRDRRYQTAENFAEDLRRVRVLEPILARPVGRWLRLRRWAQRKPALAATLAALFLSLAAGLAFALVLLDRSERERAGKETALADYDRLGDWSRLQQLRAEADRLWPCDPTNLPAMRAWLKQSDDLAKRLDEHRTVLANLRTQGIALAPESRGADSRPADSRASWRFQSPALQFKHDTTENLVRNLTAFVDPDPKFGLRAEMVRRVAFTESVERETIEAPAARWVEAIRSIADATESPIYRGLVIRPQLGLIPIGKDPASGLWEFLHLQTAAPNGDPIPRRGPNGRFVVTEAMGMVFILLPGGPVRIGSTRPPDEDTPMTTPYVDAEAEVRESPILEVKLHPFFISKYEMTQSQWLRLVLVNPSNYSPGDRFGGEDVGLANPVEEVTWEDCDLWLGRLGLVIPTEAQWEYAARGGTTTPRWTGIGTEGLVRAANLADEFCRRNGGPSNWQYESWNDGHTVHTAIGSFEPNPFGLHDVLGNVSEWCRDWLVPSARPLRDGDGMCTTYLTRNRVYRGGSFASVAALARSAVRIGASPDHSAELLGVRPARAVR
jgi:serine/threonine protein kinase/formylglycine-generating enzyme required for sulfatase activity